MAGARIEGTKVPRVARWVITLAVGAGVFALSWWICVGWLAMSSGDAIGIAAMPSALAMAPLGWWAGRDPTTPSAPAVASSSKQHNVIEGDATDVVQARDVGVVGSVGGYHVHVDRIEVVHPQPALVPATGQVVVGPIPREPQHFQHRRQIDELARLAESGVVAVVCAVTGQRGVGKTQMVGAYARQRIADGWLVAWISSETADAVTTGLGELADALHLRREGDADTTTLARLRSHLQTLRDSALLVFDNVTNPDHVTPHLPAAGSAQIVLTSATHVVDGLGTPVPVDLFTPDTAVRFLIDTTGIDDEPGARVLTEKLGYLPLALAQAAARIAQPPVDVDYTAYLRRLENVSLDQALTARPGDPYPLGAAEAILLAVEPFMTPDTTAERALLDLLSVLSSDGVSRGLLNTSRDPAEDPGDVGDLLEALFATSLIEFAGSTDNVVVVMHRLTQRALRDRANHNLTAVLDRAADLLDQATFPDEQAWQQRDLGDELIRHIDTLWEHTTNASAPASTTHHVLALRRWAVRQLITTAALERAIPLAATVHTDHSHIHGPHHPDTLASVNNLADVYRDAGRVEEAIVLYEQTLADRRRVLGDNHPATLGSVNNLATAYHDAGRAEEAIVLFEQTLATARRVLGDDHPKTLLSVNNLASAYREARRVEEAIVLFGHALADRRRVLGDNHPDTLSSVNNLAFAYHDAGRMAEAIPLFEQAQAEQRRVLGDNHPDTLSSVNNLASAYHKAGRLEEAIPLFEQTLAEQRRVLGDNHPNTLLSVNNLATAYHKAGRVAEAIVLLEHALADRRRVLDDNHPDTLLSVNNLAYAYHEAGRMEEAIPLFEQALADQRRVLDDNHPDTLLSVNNLAYAYRDVGRMEEAIPLYEQALADRRRVLGDNHPDTLASVSNLAFAYHDAGRMEEAIALVEQTGLVPPGHPPTT